MTIGVLDNFARFPDVGGGVGLTGRWINQIFGQPSLVAGRFSGQAVYYNSGGAGGTVVRQMFLPVTPTSQCVASFAWKSASLGLSGDGQAIIKLCAPDYSDRVQLTLSLNDEGIVKVWVGDVGGTLVGTCPRALNIGTWRFIEIELVLHAVAGRISIKMDGEPQVVVDTYDTLGYPGDARVGRFLRQAEVSGSGTDYATGTLGDFSYRWDESVGPGENEIIEYLPDANDSVEWTPSAGANHENVDDATTDSDATYNSSTTDLQKDIFTLADPTGHYIDIFGVGIQVVARKEASGTQTVATILGTHELEYQGDPYALSLDYFDTTTYYSVNPFTLNRFTFSEIGDLKAGYILNP